MCQTINPIPGARHGSVHWVSSKPSRLLAAGDTAYLCLTVTNHEPQFYAVRQYRDGRGLVNHYTLEPLGVNDGRCFTVDVSFDRQNREHWICDCYAAQNWYRGRAGCEHVGGLFAALSLLQPRGIALAA